MRTIINNAAIVILSMVVFTILPATMSAADMWSETPDLNDDTEAASVVIGPTTFKYSSPVVDMWAETPDLNTKNQVHGVNIDENPRLVQNFNPDMYAETPDLMNQTFSDRQFKIFEDNVISEK